MEETYLSGETFIWRETHFSGKVVTAAAAAMKIDLLYREIYIFCYFFQFGIVGRFFAVSKCYETVAQKVIKIPYNLSQCGNHGVRGFFSRRFLFMRFHK